MPKASGGGDTPELGGLGRALLSNQRRVHALFVAGLLLSGLIYNLAMVSHFNFDDYQLIILNPSIRSFSRIGEVLAAGHPVRGLTLMADYALWGLNPRGYHMENVVWHVLGAVLFYALVFRIFRRPRLAGVAAVLFAFHPIHTEAVMAVTHRKDLLAFAFMLLAFHAYLYRPRFSKAASVFSLVFFTLAVLSKQVALALPALVLLHEWLKPGAGIKWRRLATAAPLVIVAAALIVAGILVSVPVLRDFNPFGKVAPAELDMVEYSRVLATSFSVFPRYLRCLAFPVHQSLTPQISITSFAEARTWLGVLLFAALPVAAVVLRRDRELSFALGWVFLTLAPVMNWVPANDFFAERYLFAPSAGFCLLVAALWERLYLSERELFSRRGYRAAGLVVLIALLWPILASPVAQRINVLWPKDGTYLMDRTQALALSAGAAALLALMLIALLEYTGAAARLRRRGVVEFAGLYAIYGLGSLLTVALTQGLLRGHVGIPSLDLQHEWGRMLQFISGHARPGPWGDSTVMFPWGTTASELGVLAVFAWGGASLVLLLYCRVGRYWRKFSGNREVAWQVLLLIVLAMLVQVTWRCGDWASEVRLWTQTVMEEPRSLWGWNNLGKAYMDRRRYDLAAEAFRKTTELDPRGAGNFRNLGIALMGMRDVAGSRQAFARAVKLDPGDIASRNNLANLLVVEAEQGKGPGCKEAIGQYMEILRQDPRNAHARYNLAWCYLKLGDPDAALPEIMRTLELDPSSEKARALREEIIEAQGGRR